MEVGDFLEILCPFDLSHTINASKVKSHIPKCIKVRDRAWELCQPFVTENFLQVVEFEQSQSLDCFTLPEAAIKEFKDLKASDDLSAPNVEPTYLNFEDCVCVDQSFISVSAKASKEFFSYPAFLHSTDSGWTATWRNNEKVDLRDIQAISKYFKDVHKKLLVEFNKSFEYSTQDRLKELQSNPKKHILEILHYTTSQQSKQRDLMSDIKNRFIKVDSYSINKHDVQDIIILDIVYELSAFKNRDCLFIEYAAGGGALTRFLLQAALHWKIDSRHICIDREKRRARLEQKNEQLVKYKDDTSEKKVQRLRCVINDLNVHSLLEYLLAKNEAAGGINDLRKPPNFMKYLHLYQTVSCETLLEPKLKQYIISRAVKCGHALPKPLLVFSSKGSGTASITCVGKHLCGNATDEAIRVATVLLPSLHLETHIGIPQAFEKSHSQYFDIAASLTGWSTHAKNVEKQQTGIHIKRAIDFCRLSWLKMYFANARIVKLFDEPCITTENIAIVTSELIL